MIFESVLINIYNGYVFEKNSKTKRFGESPTGMHVLISDDRQFLKLNDDCNFFLLATALLFETVQI